MPETAIEWLERHAVAYHEAHQDPVLGPKLPPAPTHLVYPGVEHPSTLGSTARATTEAGNAQP